MTSSQANQLKIIYKKCEGKSVCEFETTDEFFQETSSCSRDKGTWMKYRFEKQSLILNINYNGSDVMDQMQDIDLNLSHDHHYQQ